MIIPVNLLKKYCSLDDSQMDQLMPRIGSRLVEIEQVIDTGNKYNLAVVVKVVSAVDHPDSDHLHVCLIDDGGVTNNVTRNEDGLVQVVCGAPNVFAGMKAVWLPPGAVVPETFSDTEPFKLSVRKLRGVVSNGMLASPQELDLGDEHDGILDISQTDYGVGESLSQILDFDKEKLIDVENKSLTHRPDCFGLIGFAREVAAIFNQKMVSPDWLNRKTSLSPEEETIKPTATIASLDICSRYQCVALDNINMTEPSPLTMRSALIKLGAKPTSLVVDITNFLMFETGQPLHAFDLDKLMELSPTGQPDMVVRLGKSDEQLVLLDGRTIQLTNDDIVVAVGTLDNSVAVALAGAMGGEATKVTDNTKRVLLESATFDLYRLRGTQFRQGIFTDTITRFTKGQPAELTLPVINQAVAMLQANSSARQISQVIDNYQSPRQLPQFEISLDCFSDILGQINGADYSGQLVKSTLENLGYGDVVLENNQIKAICPWWRTDLHIKEDVIEDVGRVNGYDNITSLPPQRFYQAAEYEDIYLERRRLRQRLVRAGANEVMTYSFIAGDLLDKVLDDKSQAFQIVNAVSPKLEFYRRDILPNLLEKAGDNIRSYNQFTLFEIGKVHQKGKMDASEPSLPAEIQRLSALIVDSKGGQGSAYYEAKALLEFVYSAESFGAKLVYRRLDQISQIEQLKGDNLTVPIDLFEPTRSAVVLMIDSLGQIIPIGAVGEFKLSVRHSFKLPDHLAGFSLDISPRPFQNNYTVVNKYQGTSRDITARVTADIVYGDIASCIELFLINNKPDNWQFELSPVDIYAPDDEHINYTFHIKFDDLTKTIDVGQVNDLMDKLSTQLADDLTATIV